jgi:serine/threonine protein kinase
MSLDGWWVAETDTRDPALTDRANFQENVMNHFSPESASLSSQALGHSQRVDAAYVEFCMREQAGEKVDPDEFCRNHLSIQSSLLRLVQCHQLLANCPELRNEQPRDWPVPGANYLGRYILLHEIGKGAFSRVYVASDSRVGNRNVVIKVSPFGQSEAQILGRIEHPNIVTIYAVEDDDENRLSALCMPLQGYATLLEVLDHVRANSAIPKQAEFLKELASRNPAGMPAVRRAASSTPEFPADGSYVLFIRQLALQLLDALAVVHRHGVVHSDLKPSNILLAPGGAPILLDFNLADDAQQDLVRRGGTLFYMSPEQIEQGLHPQSAAKLTPQSDLYSLGVILYELLTGKHPFGPLPLRLEFESLRDLLQSRQISTRVDIRAENPDIDATFAEFIEKCLSPDPSNRPESAKCALDLLRVSEAPNPTPRKKSRWRTIGLTAALGAIVALAMSAFLWRNPATTPDPAKREIPKSQPDEFDLAEQAMRDKRWQEAVELYTRCMESRQDKVELYRRRGEALLRIAETASGAARTAKFTDADHDLAMVDQSRPDAQSKSRLGYLRQELRRNDHAKLLYQEAIAKGNKQASVRNNLGMALRLVDGDLEGATQQFSEAIVLNPEHPTPRFNRAGLYRHFAVSASSPQERAEWLKKAEADCLIALKGPKTGMLLLEVATILAWKHEQAPEHWILAIDALKDSIAHGIRPDSDLNANSMFPSDFRSSEAFVQCLKVLPLNSPLRAAQRLMSPLDD